MKQGANIYGGDTGKAFILAIDEEISPSEFLDVCDVVQRAVSDFYAGRGKAHAAESRETSKGGQDQ